MSSASASTPSGGASPGKARGHASHHGSSSRGSGSAGRGGDRGGARRRNFGGSLTATGPTTSSRKGKGRVHEQDEDSGTGVVPSSETSTHPDHDTQPSSNGRAEQATEPPPEADLCFICADPVKLYSVAPCDHKTCHICAVRLRALYKKKDCTFCKTPIESLIFTSSADKSFTDFQPSDIPYKDAKLSIHFETKEAMEETLILLRFNCPDTRCEVASGGWQDFKMHARRDHGRLTCDLCIRHKKIFAHEHTLHTQQSLSAHMSKEHRFCEYCREYFYDDDQLFVHMRERHEQCHICKARGGENRYQYFKDYHMLERHFKDAHYLCLSPDCLEKKFVVFESEMDFKSHQVSEHGSELSSRERREALRIEANFTYEDGGGDSSRGARSGGRRKGAKGGRANRDTDSGPEVSDPLGVSALASRSNVPGAGPASNTSRRAMFSGSLTPSSPAVGPSPGPSSSATADASTAERHAAYLNRVLSILKGSESKLNSFRASVKTYRASEMSAKDLVHTISSVVGDLDESAIVVNGLVDLLEDEEKKGDVLQAWNSLRVERTQFPSLVPASSSSNTQDAGIAQGKIRNVKKASASNNQVWANVERAASASSGHKAGKPSQIREHFPTLGRRTPAVGGPSIPGSAGHSLAARAATAQSGSTPWASGPAGKAPAVKSQVGVSSSPSPFVAHVTGSKSSGSKVNTNSASAFPSLPTNASQAAFLAHKKALLAKGKNKSPSSPSSSGTSTPWATASTPTSGRIDGLQDEPLAGLSEALAASRLSSTEASSEAGQGKKKKGKGVPLMSFGGVHRG
ncbi:hypothetical protein IE53DRAFT_190151 [Violaceomyces palustris]|uniref:Uncharacterized protein n=1 Tax=Violaceomyces palustris TaxID=1673888 RepID=A0ACD0P5H3_9BASI|nr:hypothetical protein IE53DRAFT_190151 [Violaceomyces palustris]